jgi:uncharacterized membrane protein (DUF2068 family)
MRDSLLSFTRLTLAAARDLTPIVLVVAFFQIFILRLPFPDLGDIAVGMALVVVGLALFVHGLNEGLFPIGESLAGAFAQRGSLFVMLLFAFLLGFGTTVAEPALIAVAQKAAETAAEAGHIGADGRAMDSYAQGLRYTVGLSVGVALTFGVFRIIKGWPVHHFIIGGYFVVAAMTFFAPPEIIGIAYDSGGVTTSTVTVPLVTAIGVGLASVIRGRNPLVDGFGLIAFASLTPIIFVLAYGMLS